MPIILLASDYLFSNDRAQAWQYLHSSCSLGPYQTPSGWQITFILTLSPFLLVFFLWYLIFAHIFDLGIDCDKLHLFFLFINYHVNDYNKNLELMELITYVFRFLIMGLMMVCFLF